MCIYFSLFIKHVILRAVACDMLYVTRMIGGLEPVLFLTNSQTFPFSPSISLSLFSLLISISFHLCLSSSLPSLLLFSLLLCCGVFCAAACSVLCCCVLLCVVVLCVCACLCVSLCHMSGVEQCVQVKRINGGLGNVFSTYSQTENR